LPPDKGAILLVDDEERVIELLSLYLKKEGFSVQTARDGQEALEKARHYKPALVVLDLMLPKLDGIEVCRRLRQFSAVPVIMLTVRDDDLDKILGLEMGADDYVTKPFNPREVVARIKAILRRLKVAKPEERIINLPALEINLRDYEVKLKGKPVAFTPKEIETLWLLASHPGRVFTRENLLEQIWGYDYVGDTRTVDTHIKRIRHKLSDPQSRFPWELKTVWGVGYKFELQTDPRP
jgi:DNA-binding response OmpR family regulator